MADPVQVEAVATNLQLAGAGSFGAIIGWYVYYINRYRRGDVQFSDIVTLVGAIGGSAVLALFPARGDLFGAYGIGLAIGFFGYFLVLSGLVAKSRNFNSDFFLDGRRKRLELDEYIPSEEEVKGLTRPGMSGESDKIKIQGG
jgi:hypothetical protein